MDNKNEGGEMYVVLIPTLFCRTVAIVDLEVATVNSALTL